MAPSLLVPFDSTEGAWRALHVADTYALRADLAVDLVMVGSSGLEAQDRMELADAAVRLHAAKGELLVIAGDDVAGEIAASLSKHPEATGWMATHGRSRLGSLMLGSTAEAVVRRSARPLVLVGPRAESTTSWGPVVVCAEALSPPSAVLPAARQWAERLRCPLRLVTVDEDRPLEEIGTESLQTVAEELRAGGLDADVEVLAGRHAAEEIERYATRHGAALVAMPTHARTGVHRAVLGSVTMAVVHRAACPVLVTAAG